MCLRAAHQAECGRQAKAPNLLRLETRARRASLSRARAPPAKQVRDGPAKYGHERPSPSTKSPSRSRTWTLIDSSYRFEASVLSCDHIAEYILIEDTMSTGGSIIETIQKLEGKKVTDVAVIIDRESVRCDNLTARHPDIRLHSVLGASHVLANRRQW